MNAAHSELSCADCPASTQTAPARSAPCSPHHRAEALHRQRWRPGKRRLPPRLQRLLRRRSPSSAVSSSSPIPTTPTSSSNSTTRSPSASSPAATVATSASSASSSLDPHTHIVLWSLTERTNYAALPEELATRTSTRPSPSSSTDFSLAHLGAPPNNKSRVKPRTAIRIPSSQLKTAP